MRHPIIKVVALATLFTANTVVAQEPQQPPVPEPSPTPIPFFAPINKDNGGMNYCELPNRGSCMYCPAPQKPPAGFS